MNQRDLDLILDLIGNRLPPEEATAARERIAADPELSAALDAQRWALEAMQTLPPVALTTEERIRLRAGLREQLHLDDEAAPASARPRTKRGLGWLAASAVGIAAVIVGTIAVLPRPSGSDTASLSAALTTAPATPQQDRDLVEDAAGGATFSTTTAAAEAAPPEAPVPLVSGLVIAGADGAAVEDELERKLTSVTSFAHIDVTAVEECVASIADQLPGIEPAHTIEAVDERDGREVVILSYVDPSGQPVFVAIDPTVCTVVETTDS